jgi:hypothetical protein
MTTNFQSTLWVLLNNLYSIGCRKKLTFDKCHWLSGYLHVTKVSKWKIRQAIDVYNDWFKNLWKLLWKINGKFRRKSYDFVICLIKILKNLWWYTFVIWPNFKGSGDVSWRSDVESFWQCLPYWIRSVPVCKPLTPLYVHGHKFVKIPLDNFVSILDRILND